MKKLTIRLILILFLIPFSNTFSQLAKDSWSLGFGASYPRMMSLWEGSWAGRANYGGYLSLKRNFSEHVAMRLVGAYSYMETRITGGGGTHSVRILATDVEMLYYPVPCETLTPYLLIGFGGILFRNENSPQSLLDVTYYEYQYNLGFGGEWKFSDNWSLTGEGIYHTASTNKLDGHDDPGADKGLFGGNADTYIRLNLGLLYYFSKGEPSAKCDLFPGIIEKETIIKEVPREVIKEVVVEKPVEVKESRWILVGVNFEFDKATLMPESYPILFNALQVLNNNPDMKVEIGGHTDWIGTDAYNQNLSERRAKTVRDYLAAKGIDPKRLTIKGYGESDPIADNTTPEGRALNRRIEFKIIE
jgi:outer membrane protein OmpA-like peptidoglycan-associated protein